ncbi:hypothetical protein GQ43DRAFT_363949 [Delitschia confertaspora ATCC 74209]|uniref:Uncharacterized protein n=1 Tax=Delitschia confertaspora ATCC 74209 TaxID=1513339 RepID=A0A9P4JSH8_9PLEO|nr:hypothetical protein GQ43DRAFT_363949 [Delitschia confertaspora ATCC 74209]
MDGVRAHIVGRLRSSSLNTAPPPQTSSDYSASLARDAASILYRSPIPSKENRPVYILNAAALPDSRESDFDALLPYVLARLPEEDDLLKGSEYEVIFFAGDSDGSTTIKKNRPSWGWFLQAYHVLSRAMRKRLQKLYIVHEKAWVRILTEIFSTIVSPKFRRKIIHASSMTNLALYIPIEDLLIPPSAYLHDRRVSEDIFAPYASGQRAFGVRQPFPISSTGKTRFPRVLRETTSFVLLENNICTEGLFRVSPHSKLKDILKEAYDRGQKFIVWKDNGVTLPTPKYPRAEHLEEIIEEVDMRDAYGAIMAAALIKSWYSDLHQPLFPQTCYGDLKRLFGDPDDLPDLEKLKDLISPSSEWSFLPATSREIMARHLLPLLDAVSARQEQNKMTEENLAVCFAPALLCGLDQLEDAKMSSIIRRILTVAVELWSQGLRECCGISTTSFEDDLRFPESERDWEDPLEGSIYRSETYTKDENQVTGIILQDNESISSEAPPLRPHHMNWQGQSAYNRSSNDSATRRKPAPPLTVASKHSTIISDSIQDITGSPTSHADEKKSGTNKLGDSHIPPQIILPKRKALTAEQINNAENATAQVQARKVSQIRMALPGLTGINTGEFVRRKSVPSTQDSPESTTISESPVPISPADTPPSSRSGMGEPQPLDPLTQFCRPILPASAYRTPNITSLARPVYPSTNAIPRRPASKSTSLPVPTPKPRAPSPGLLQRMPSFETSNNQRGLAPPVAPRKLNIKKASVDDLRRLYEERAGTAQTLVEAAKQK